MHQLPPDLVATWLDLTAAMTVRDLIEDRVPYASLASGAAGIGCVAGRIGRARGDRELLATCRRWFEIAARAAARPGGLRPKGWPTSRYSVMFGEIGIAAGRALVLASPRAIGDFAAIVERRMGRAPAEVVHGLAGIVFATIDIARASKDPRATALVGDLAVRLAKAPLPGGAGFAHGDAGVFAARLAASRFLGEPAGRAVVDALARLPPGGPDKLARSWCNGLAGQAIAWVIGAEVAGDDRCRARALAAGPHLLEELDESGGSVCCGLGGRAYALLAIARLDPSGPWIEHAQRLARRALAHPIPHGGMLQGLPGLVGLAHDLQTPHSARLPFVDVA